MKTRKGKVARQKEAAPILRALRTSLEKRSKLPTWLVLITLEKLTPKHKTTFIDDYEGKTLNFQLTITTAIEPFDKKWVEAEFNFREQPVLTFGERGKGIISIVKDFVKRSIADGKIQDFL